MADTHAKSRPKVSWIKKQSENEPAAGQTDTTDRIPVRATRSVDISFQG